jgi:hypothetical protein
MNVMTDIDDALILIYRRRFFWKGYILRRRVINDELIFLFALLWFILRRRQYLD